MISDVTSPKKQPYWYTNDTSDSSFLLSFYLSNTLVRNLSLAYKNSCNVFKFSLVTSSLLTYNYESFYTKSALIDYNDTTTIAWIPLSKSLNPIKLTYILSNSGPLYIGGSIASSLLYLKLLNVSFVVSLFINVFYWSGVYNFFPNIWTLQLTVIRSAIVANILTFPFSV